MKILVTGANGQLGSDIAPLLKGAGFEAVCFGSAGLDITDPVKVFKAVSGHRPGIIINCAAYTKVDLAEKEREKAFAVNSAGVANIARAAKETGAAVIHVSTDFVFDGSRPSPYSEEAATNPLSAYGESKLEGERALAGILEEHVIVRTSWLYGTTGHNFVKTMLRLASERELIRVVYDQAGTPTWSADLASALVEAARAVNAGKRPWGLYHYSNEGVASWYDLAVAACAGAAGLGMDLRCKNIEPILTAEYPTPAKRPAYSVMDKAKIKKQFGISIPHWRASLEKMLAELGGRISN